MLKKILLMCCILSVQMAKGQERKGQYWTRYFNEISAGSWDINTELESRRLISPHTQQQLILRTVGLYKFNDNIEAGAGFLYSRAYDEERSGFSVPELRPFQQLIVKHKAGKLNFDHTLRVEQRFQKETFQEELLSTYDFSLRTRYNIQAGYSILKKDKEKGHLGVQVSQEVFVNVASSDNFFDQNRLYAGVVFQPAKAIALELGYMWMYQQQSDKPDENSDIVRFTLRHYLNF